MDFKTLRIHDLRQMTRFRNKLVPFILSVINMFVQASVFISRKHTSLNKHISLLRIS
jgi:hypothetical protein